MSCSLCLHKGSCKVYKKLRELEEKLQDFWLVWELEEEIAGKCMDYE